jgi:hypothetical protein
MTGPGSGKGAKPLWSAPLPEKARQVNPCRASLRTGETSLFLAVHVDDLTFTLTRSMPITGYLLHPHKQPVHEDETILAIVRQCPV